jgi:environmental stress-induced protein Ves
MSGNLVRLDDVRPVPWKTGGGVTRELLAWPGAQDWRVRMSVADVAQDGPFSRFEGVRRWFSVLDGAGVRLRIEGAAHDLTSTSPPFAFDGGAACDCALLAGPTRDFNLMLRSAIGGMLRVQRQQFFGCGRGQLVAVYSCAGPALAGFGADRIELGPHTLAWRILEADGAVHLDAPDALWMEITP